MRDIICFLFTFLLKKEQITFRAYFRSLERHLNLGTSRYEYFSSRSLYNMERTSTGGNEKRDREGEGKGRRALFWNPFQAGDNHPSSRAQVIFAIKRG